MIYLLKRKVIITIINVNLTTFTFEINYHNSFKNNYNSRLDYLKFNAIILVKIQPRQLELADPGVFPGIFFRLVER